MCYNLHIKYTFSPVMIVFIIQLCFVIMNKSIDVVRGSLKPDFFLVDICYIQPLSKLGLAQESLLDLTSTALSSKRISGVTLL